MQNQNISIGDRIKAVREKKGLSQKALADKIGIKQPSLSEIEKNKSVPREATLLALARALNDDLGEAWITDRLAEKKGDSWDVLLRPIAWKIKRDDAFLYVLVYKLGSMSETFRSLLRDGIYENMKAAFEGVFDAPSIGDEVGPIEPAEMILAPVVARIVPGPKAVDPKEEIRQMLGKEETRETDKWLKPRKRKTG